MEALHPEQHYPQQQQQQQQGHYYDDRQEEYRQAQRAAVEAVHVGRETLQHSVQQGEQLNRALSMADETEYKLDKAGRILRGMTWSGWVANMFTKPVGPTTQDTEPTSSSSSRTAAAVPAVYDQVTPECQETAQALQNYNANVTVLESCDTEDQKQTLQTICDTMYDNAHRSLGQLKEDHPKLDAYAIQFERDLAILRNRQKQSQERTRQLGSLPSTTGTRNVENETDQDRAELFSSVVSSQKKPQDSTGVDRKRNTEIHPHQREQDQHLAVMAQSLGELGTIAQNLHTSIGQQSHTIDSLDTRTDTITEKSKMVTRRADRMVQKRSWTPVKATFYSHVVIRHVATGRYLASVDTSNLVLVPRYHPDTCVFGLWNRQGTIFGLQNKHNNRWAGQSVFGSLACSASWFGRREEWEAGDDDWKSTRLLCCSAGWGAGGYLTVRPHDCAVLIGGCTVEERNKADVWSIVSQDDHEPNTLAAVAPSG